MNAKVYANGNYFIVDFDGKPEVLEDGKGNVNVSLIDDTSKTFLIQSPRIGSHEIALANLQTEAGAPYDLASWTTFYRENSGFNPATGGSVAAAWGSISGDINTQTDLINKFPGNVVVVNSLADLPAPVAGVYTLSQAAPTAYCIAANLDLAGDRIEIGNTTMIVGRFDDLASLTSTGLVGSLITNNDNNLKIQSITLNCPTGTILTSSDSTNSKELKIQNVKFQNCNRAISLGNMYDVHINDVVHFSEFNEGIVITQNIRHLHMDHLFVSHTRNSGTGPTTFLDWGAFKAEIFDFKDVNITAVDPSDVAIDVSGVDPTTFNSVYIDANRFSNYGVLPLAGADADTLNWNIPSRGNIGLAGLFTTQITLTLDSYSGGVTFPSFGVVPTTQLIRTAAEYEPNATKLRALLEVNIAYDLNSAGATVYVDLAEYQNGTYSPVAGSSSAIDFTGRNTYPFYYVERTNEVTLNPNTAYRPRIARHTGAGNPSVYFNSAKLLIKAF